MNKSLDKYVADSVEIDKKFKRKFDIDTRMISLSEEIGELAHAFLIIEERKNDGTTPTIAENLTNLLYEIFLISSHYQVDLDEAWQVFLQTMPGWAEKRNK